MICIAVIGSDDRMDCREMFYGPLNPLPPKCPSCGFPDLDFVPQPYYLVRSRTLSPNEMASAENGNFLVRERVRRVLELLAPGQCQFFPTHYRGTSEETPWHLAVPAHQVVTARVDHAIPRCRVCGQPRSAHPGSQYREWLWDYQSEYDTLKSATWGSSEAGWDKWLTRDLFLSVRLFRLLREIKARGLNEVTCGGQTFPDAADAAWVREGVEVLRSDGIALHAAGILSDEDAKWFRGYVRSHARVDVPSFDLRAWEKRLRFRLPRSYSQFITRVGPAIFPNVDGQEGFTAHILGPDDLDVDHYRAGERGAHDAETDASEAVMFARTEHGDSFCFDVSTPRREYPVLLYKHEYSAFEPYAENFAAFIRRLTDADRR